MADRTRLAAAGLFLALALAAVPALLPIDLGAVGGEPRAEAAAGGLAAIAAQGMRAAIPGAAAAASPGAAGASSLVRLRGGDLRSPREVVEDTYGPQGVLRRAIAEAAPRPHIVAPGETLWKISQDAGLGVEALAAANHLTVGAILRPGQMLMVPPVDPAAPMAGAPTHEVAPGETLWDISHASGLRVETLATANHLSADAVLHPGQVLVLPSSGSSPAPQARVRFRGQAAAAGAGLAAIGPPEVHAGGAGALDQPSEGMITSRFGWRIHPIFGTREFHTGVDIANRMGTPIRAAESGIVRFAGWMGGYGRLIVVAHPNGLETSYSHLSAMLVKIGERVVRGQVLARMGSTGWSTGPHLFFEVRRNGVALDPVPFLHGAGGTTAMAARGAPASAAKDRQVTAPHGAPATVAKGSQVTAQGAPASTQQGRREAVAQGAPATATQAAPAASATSAASPVQSTRIEERRSHTEPATDTAPTP